MKTSSGIVCDVCNRYILPIDPNERINTFSIQGIEEVLVCCNKCKKLIKDINGDWTKLPTEGQLYNAFKEAGERMQKMTNLESGKYDE